MSSPPSVQSPPPRLIVGITGATGAVYGVRLLQHLRRLGGVRSHLVVSPAGWMSLRAETDLERRDVEALADEVHPIGDVAASIASGSFATLGMVVAPCSMKTLAAVAHGLSDNLLSRAADVCLKERRRLVLLARETPLNLAHLRNMTLVTEMGGVVMPPLPALYLRPRSLEEMVDHTLGRVLEQFGLAHDLAPAWTGWPAPEGAGRA
ncbi:UbiX family flavin prenyltransferase [Thiomonas sp. FB-6]|uniref:UbiX family flavin prenyltransferase n=1 Tax=Thiomonas sp. FB-6 TaxID=1158291 RepID=UPI0003A675FE|nr:UbiX family flavin prenyltransferase [Thiomonas sp. FB-6]